MEQLLLLEDASGANTQDIIDHLHLQKYIHPESGTPLLSMELMDENLTSFLERLRETHCKRLSECVQVKIGTDVSQALTYLHANCVVH